MAVPNLTKLKYWRLAPTVTPLVALLKWCRATYSANRILFVVRLEFCRKKWKPTHPRIPQRIEAALGSTLIDKFCATGWPGTVLLDGLALIYVLDLNKRLEKILTEWGPCLADWQHARCLPEDLCVFAEGAAYPAFFSVTHENDAWMIASRKDRFEGVRDTIRLGQWIFDERYYCKGVNAAAELSQGFDVRVGGGRLASGDKP